MAIYKNKWLNTKGERTLYKKGGFPCSILPANTPTLGSIMYEVILNQLGGDMFLCSHHISHSFQGVSVHWVEITKMIKLFIWKKGY